MSSVSFGVKVSYWKSLKARFVTHLDELIKSHFVALNLALLEPSTQPFRVVWDVCGVEELLILGKIDCSSVINV